MIILKHLRIDDFKLLKRVAIDFPSQGAVLVEGLNESGKSTLFESVYFALYGVPLVTEGKGKGTLESVIRYGEDAASVELVLEVDETEIEVRRVVKRSRPTTAKLIVRRPGSPEEQVTGVLAVNARIVEELGGLDGEALLNSCFVEQKKLSKLEDLASGQRRDSLRKLLNLDKLTALSEKFRVTPQDERALSEAKSRLELAEVAAKLPAVTAEQAVLEASLRGEIGDGRAGACPPPQIRGYPDDGGGQAPALRNPAPQPVILSAAKDLPHEAATDRENTNHWQEAADRLVEIKSSVVESRRRATLFTIGAIVLLAAVALLYLVGLPSVSWGLPFVLVLALLAWRSYGRAKDLAREIPPLEAELTAHRDTIVKRTGELEGLRQRAETMLGVEAANLNTEECRQEVERLSREIAVKRQAGAIVEGAMERIVRMVLPSTERNLGQILPLLTAGRYHEARIAEDYQVQVWDDSAGRYVSKSVFSGGARDQFSLALRLAFALATLPEELGTTPGFIFLDEPLSSFDGPRTEALVRLLTEGQVAASFSQIFVISHNRSFDPNAFPYRLVLRDGKVVESNLQNGEL